jgi:hypothetical protein
MFEIEVDDMIARGKKGFIAKIVSGGERQFLPVISRTGYSHSKEVLTYQIEDDGIYEIQDANFGGRLRREYIKVENSEIVAREKSLDTLLAADVTNLPELEGSEKQVDWAFNIREKLIAKLKKANKDLPKWIYTTTSAKFYIDHRPDTYFIK